jgi:5-(carboxyamino)imidazole ribonucleotide synthase
MRIGILGGGQLGLMLAEAAARMGIATRVLDPANDAPAARAAEHTCAPFEDIEALGEFARSVDLVTYEFENVPVASVEWLAERVAVAPSPAALRTAQDRLLEKEFFVRQGVRTPPFAPVGTHEEYRAALLRIGVPAVVKTRRFGYDGKGQRVVRSLKEAEAAWAELHGVPLLVEGFVAFERELSIIAVGQRDGGVRFFPLVENHHRRGILRLSIAPAPDAEELAAEAEACARAAIREFRYVGVLAVEFFQRDGHLYANEMAPRVHNSGHWTLGGAPTSQFAAHVAAIAGLPIGELEPAMPSAMVNLIGAMPDGRALREIAGTHVVDYGKSPRAGRKLGHVTIVAEDMDLLMERVDRVRRLAEAAGG